MSSAPRLGLLIAAASVVLGLVGISYLGHSLKHHAIQDGTTIAIRSVHTGKYLSVSPEDGLLRASANNTKDVGARFKMVTLSVSTVRMLHPVKVQHKTTSKRGCPCSGFSDEHGFGRFCHNWESEHHRPWCYVSDKCAHAQKGRKMRKHQACTSEEGYIGPAGFVSPPGCPCSGHESVHGFGGFCKGWEFPGQTPWCYTYDNCSLVADAPGTYGAKFVNCVSNSTEPPPPPLPPRRATRGSQTPRMPSLLEPESREPESEPPPRHGLARRRDRTVLTRALTASRPARVTPYPVPP